MNKSAFNKQAEASLNAEHDAKERQSDRSLQRVSASARGVPQVYRLSGKIESFGSLLDQPRKR